MIALGLTFSNCFLTTLNGKQWNCEVYEVSSDSLYGSPQACYRVGMPIILEMFLLPAAMDCPLVDLMILCHCNFDLEINLIFLNRGLTPRLVMYVSQGALFFASYELFKSLFCLEVPKLHAQVISQEGDSTTPLPSAP